MKRNLLFRFFLVAFVAVASVLLLSYVHARTAQSDDTEPTNECGKQRSGSQSGKAKTEYILWEALTHNLLTSR
jgi:NADH:ubiquinone oxidoreductase subunit 3 (subunit A)